MHIHKTIDIAHVNRVLWACNYPDGNYEEHIYTDESHLCNLVRIPMNDSRIYFAQRENRGTIFPMVNFDDLNPNEYHYTNIITVIFKIKKGKIIIKTAYWGEGNGTPKPQPGREDFQKCLNFWTNHALIPDEKITKCNPPHFYKPFI